MQNSKRDVKEEKYTTENGNTQVKYKYLNIVLKYSTSYMYFVTFCSEILLNPHLSKGSMT